MLSIFAIISEIPRYKIASITSRMSPYSNHPVGKIWRFNEDGWPISDRHMLVADGTDEEL